MNMPIRRNGHGSGFSLIEILIAVVILATGLLALTALQGRLAQASAEAKTRSRVASMLTSRMDQLRGSQYDSLPTGAGTGSATSTQTCASGAPAWLCAAQTESGVGSLSVTQSVVRYGSAIGATAFTFPDSSIPANLAIPEFKRITLSATWTDASAASHTLSINSDVSPMTLRDDRFPTDSDSGTAGGKAIVRQDNPAGPGVIPIAIGGGDATAASNPRPEILGKGKNASIVGTRFDVLTYEGVSGPSVIQRRVETAAIACTCQYGAGGSNLGEIYRVAQWPAEWTGERYEVANPGSTAPGTTLSSGPKPGVEQSPLCTECCRDHHDAAGNPVLFDPERSGGYEHYNASMTAVAASSGNDYMEACRIIRIDGFWRTATDMYAKHVGLLKTASVAGVEAKTGAPDDTAVATYQSFVKNYLAGYNGTAANIANAADGGQVSGTISIIAPPTQDERYLHARGLYVDYLNQKAKDRILQAKLPANCPVGSDATECMLPYLPFTTINATELAYWEPQVSGTRNTSILAVATGSSLVYNPLQPTRGRTNAKAGATNGATSDAAVLISRSNAGVAIADEVDPDDATALGKDKQEFRVVASGSGVVGETFRVQLIGLPQTSDTNTSNDPAVTWTNATGSADCNSSFADKKDKDPNNYRCDTYGTLGIATAVRVSNYFREYTVAQTMTATCGTQAVTATADRPTFANYTLSSASVGGVAATSLVVTNDAKATESTLASFASMPSAGIVSATFTLGSTLQADIASCVAVRKNASSPWTFSNIVWTKSWTTP